MIDMSDQGMQLIADIVSANVSNLAQVTNRIEADLRRDTAKVATDLLELWDIVAEATVVDRATERRLDLFAHRVDSAERLLAHTRSMQRRFDGLEDVGDESF